MSQKFMIAAVLGVLLTTPASAQLFGRGDAMDPFANADSNGDGVITRVEFLAARSARFARMDRNGDGVVARDDFGRMLKFRPQAGERLDAVIEQLDKNGDGRVTRAEFDAAPTLIFDRADANSDGRIDKAELAAAKQRLEALKAQRKG